MGGVCVEFSGLPTSGNSPFMAALGYQPRPIDYQEEELVTLSFRVHLRHCWGVWWQVRASLLRSSLQSQLRANRRWALGATLLPGAAYLADIKGPPAPGGLKKAGTAVCGPV